jgi:SEC-C motif
MAEASRLRQLAISEVLDRFENLRLLPSKDGAVNLRGTIEFTASANACRTVTDSYEISLGIPEAYPSELPVVHETSGRIPSDFHKLQGNALCLGSPFRLWLLTSQNPSLLTFLERVVVPYLYGYSLHEAGEVMPFGEVRHGTLGLLDDLGEMLGAPDSKTTEAYLQAMRQKKRIANKRPCPCGSGIRLGRCHNRKVNALRGKLRHTHFSSR